MTYADPVHRSLLPLLIFNTAFMTVFIYYAISFQFRKKDPADAARLHDSFLGFFFHSFWFWLVDPIVKFLAFLRMTPNSVTSLSILLSIYTGYVFAIGSLNWAGWLVIISGTFDLLDGRLARLTNQTTEAGAYYDSCMDRYNDSFVYMGLGLYFVGRNFTLAADSFTVSRLDLFMLLVAMFLIVGSQVMSYAKAKGEAMGFNTKRGLMQRPERVMFLGAIGVTYPFYKIVAERNQFHPEVVLMGGIIIMAVLVNYSAIVRIVVLFRKIKQSEKEGKTGQ